MTFARYKGRVVVVLGSQRKLLANGWTRIRFVDTDEMLNIRQAYLEPLRVEIEMRKPIEFGERFVDAFQRETTRVSTGD